MYKTALTFVMLSSPFVLPPLIAQAETTQIRPGLWEIRTSSDLLRLVPHLPADQMQNMQDLAKEYGLEMPEIENGAAISRTCITQDMAAQQELPELYQEELGCVSESTIRDGNAYKMNFTCNSTKLKGNGSAQGVITSPQSFSGNSHFKGKANGTEVDEKAEITGKWVGASCGNTGPNSEN
jgi:uncharacterized protein DUF3617